MTHCPHRTGARYCPDCGKDLAPLPFDRRTLVSDITNNWWEKGAIHTLAGLFIRPGKSIRTYIETDRDYLVKPIAYAAIVITFVFWARSRVKGLGPIDPGDSATLALLLKDPLIIAILSALIGALVVAQITHRAAKLGFYGAFVLRLYLSSQALLLAFALDVVAVQFGLQGTFAHNLAGYAVAFCWTGFAIWQYFLPDRLRFNGLRAAIAIVLGEIALFVLLIIPVVLIDETGWLG